MEFVFFIRAMSFTGVAIAPNVIMFAHDHSSGPFRNNVDPIVTTFPV